VSSRLGEAATVSSVVKFAIVGAAGFTIQISALALLTSVARWPWLPATIAAVELTIVHNFLWHCGWTWRASVSGARFLRFNASTALTSVAGNVVLMTVFVGGFGMPPVPANILAVAAMSLANFLLADRWIFSPATRPTIRPCESSTGRPSP
jgi:putative flippase GtrA